MSVGTRYFTPYAFEINANGQPLANAALYFYLTGTSTPLNTYSDVALTVPNPNPVIADANGRFASIFLSATQAYKVQLWTGLQSISTSVEVWNADPVGPAAGGAITSTAGIIGEVRTFAAPASAVPAGWYLCYGQSVSRSTYAAAFAVLGITWGAGDGSTTFNLPDLRGRSLFGVDNMGGSAASRLTAGVSGVAGSTLGASGGDQHAQADTLTATSNVTDPGHLHFLSEIVNNLGVSANAFGGATASLQIVNTNTGTNTTGITVATTVASTLTGASQNIPPASVVNMIIYLGS